MRQTQGNIQISQSDIAVDTKNPFAGGSQSCGDAGAYGSFSGTAFAGQNRNQLTQSTIASRSQFSPIIKE